MNKKIIVIGTGISTGHLTSEAKDHILKCDYIFYSSYNASLISEERISRAKNLDASFYKDGMYRPAMYKRMALKIIEKLQEVDVVGLLEPGSPVLTDLITQFISQ